MGTSIRGTFAFDRTRSTVSIRGSSSVHPIEIRSRDLEGELRITDSEREPAVVGSLIIPTKSLRTGQPLQDFELRRQIQARRYPAIEATLRRVQSVEGDTFAVSGDITFMGATQPTDGTLTITAVNGEVAITGEATFDVREFGFQPPNILGMKVDPLVTVQIDLVSTPA